MSEQSTLPIYAYDRAYVRLVKSWGSDEEIVESARTSTQRGFEGWGPKHSPECIRLVLEGAGCSCDAKSPGDEKLLRFLWESRHTGPFEHAGATLEVHAPIFVFREWHRHRTMSYSEASARYAPLPSDDYVPTFERVMGMQDGADAGTRNRQAARASGAPLLTAENADRWLRRLREHYAATEELYQLGLSIGVPKELARLPMPVARYSTMRASANLLNWFRFLRLRLAPGAQWEIRALAGCAAEILSDCFPRSSALFGESLLDPKPAPRELGTKRVTELMERALESTIGPVPVSEEFGKVAAEFARLVRAEP